MDTAPVVLVEGSFGPDSPAPEKLPGSLPYRSPPLPFTRS
jgi:hypothetical protein